MSLIHEALKKVEEKGRAGMQPNTARNPEPSSRKRGTTLLFAPLVIAALTILVYGAYRHLSPRLSGPTSAITPSRAGTSKSAENAPGHNEKALALYRANRFTEALAEFEAALARSPADSVLQNNCGLAAMYAGQTAVAGTRFKEALRLRPNYPEALNNYGALIGAGGQTAKAVELFEKALSITPGYADAELNLAAALERLGRTNEAAAHYESFLRIDPSGTDSAPARSRLVFLRAKEIRAIQFKELGDRS